MPTKDTDLTTLVGLFHTPSEAAKVLQDLEAEGVPAQSIQSLGSGASTTSAPEASLASLRSLNLPSDDLQILSDGLKSGGTVVVVRAQESFADRVEDVFESHAHQIDERTTGEQARPVASTAAVAGEAVIPIVEEQLTVGKRKVERGGVRVFSRLVETPVQEQVVLREEHASIERHAVNRAVSSTELDALQNQSIEVREMAEEAVVGKTARVVEEVRVGKESTERSQTVKDTVRKTQVEVEQIAADKIPAKKRTS